MTYRRIRFKGYGNWQIGNTIVYKINIDHIVKLVIHVSDSYKYFLEKENSFFWKNGTILHNSLV